MSAPSYRFIVSGRVQGVRFRESTREQAEFLGVSGWVRNREDGRVEGQAQGEPQALECLHQWLHRGPPAARVDALEWLPQPSPSAPPAAEERGFVVRR